MRWIVGYSLKFRFIVVALSAFLMFFGVQQVGNTAVDVFPEFAPPRWRSTRSPSDLRRPRWKS